MHSFVAIGEHMWYLLGIKHKQELFWCQQALWQHTRCILIISVCSLPWRLRFSENYTTPTAVTCQTPCSGAFTHSDWLPNCTEHSHPVSVYPSASLVMTHFGKFYVSNTDVKYTYVSNVWRVWLKEVLKDDLCRLYFVIHSRMDMFQHPFKVVPQSKSVGKSPWVAHCVTAVRATTSFRTAYQRGWGEYPPQPGASPDSLILVLLPTIVCYGVCSYIFLAGKFTHMGRISGFSPAFYFYILKNVNTRGRVWLAVYRFALCILDIC